MKRVVLVISSLGMGGAESVLAWLANGLSAQEYDVSVLTLDDGDKPPFYPLSDEIRHRPLRLACNSSGVAHAVLGNLKRIKSLRSAIVVEAPDVVVSFMEQTNVLTLLAVGRKYPVVISERVHPMHPVGRVWGGLRRRTYGLAAALVVQTESIAREYGWLRRARVAVIPNAVLPAVAKGPTKMFSGPAVVGMGRLHEQKGFDLLLKAFSVVAEDFPEWKLVVFGEGPRRGALERLARELGLLRRADFAGRTPTPHADLSQGDIFAFPSRFEGFPNALCEAMAVGLPCVAADCPGGPGDLIEDGKNGLLVPANDAEAFAGALKRLMGDKELRRRLGQKAVRIGTRFNEKLVLDMWVRCINGCIQARGDAE